MFLIDIDIVKEDNKNFVRLICEKNNKKHFFIDKKFQQYFWFIPSDFKEFSSLLPKIKKISSEVLLKKMFFLGKEVKATKIYFNSWQDFHEIKELIKEFGEICGSDISLTKRYLIENGLFLFQKLDIASKDGDIISINKKNEFLEPRVLAFDIETYSPVRKPRPKKDPIILISFYSKDFKKVIVWKKFKNPDKYIKFVDSEQELIKEFIKTINDYNPHILLGYNTDLFDFKYLSERAKINKIDLKIGIEKLRFVRRGRYSSAKIKGIQHVDIWFFIINILRTYLKTETRDLNSVSEELLGIKKLHIDFEEIAEDWSKGQFKKLGKLARYCLRDSELTYKLWEKLSFLILELASLVNLPLFDVSRMTYSQLVEWHIISKIKGFNEIIPNRPKFDEIQKRFTRTYKGGYVHEPRPGLYKDIVILDFRSLYPSIIVSYNIGPSTINCGCCKQKFCLKRKGFVPAIIGNLVKTRAKIKKKLHQTGHDSMEFKLLSARSQALKTIANAMYGYLGFGRSRWYNIECSKEITSLGRKYIKDTINKAEKQGFSVIYGDTDSTMCTLGKKSKKDVEKFLDKINKKLPKPMELELEDIYPRGIFVSKRGEATGAKKRYALINKEGRIIIKGFEFVRRGWALIAKETQMKVFEAILKQGSVKKARKIVKKVVSDLKNHKIPIEKVIILTQLQKQLSEYKTIGPHVAAALRAKEKGYHIEPGVIVKYVVTKGRGSISKKVKLASEVKDFDYDPEYYINNQVIPAVEKIFDALEISRERLTSGQISLKKFK